MKKLTKILLAVGGAALICGGSVMTYLKAQTPMSAQEKLTLANIEVIAFGLEQHTEVICRGTSGRCKMTCPNCGKFDFGKGAFPGSHDCTLGF